MIKKDGIYFHTSYDNGQKKRINGIIKMVKKMENIILGIKMEK